MALVSSVTAAVAVVASQRDGAGRSLNPSSFCLSFWLFRHGRYFIRLLSVAVVVSCWWWSSFVLSLRNATPFSTSSSSTSFSYRSNETAASAVRWAGYGRQRPRLQRAAGPVNSHTDNDVNRPLSPAPMVHGAQYQQ